MKQPQPKHLIDGIEILRPGVDYTLEDVLARGCPRWTSRLGEAACRAGFEETMALRATTFDANSETRVVPISGHGRDFLKLAEAQQRQVLAKLDSTGLSTRRVFEESEVPYARRVRELLRIVPENARA